MARQRDPRRDQAKEMWLDSDGKKLLKDIAKEFGVSDSQIRKWKSIDKWSADLKGNVTNDKGNVTKRGGAPLGNQNAKGNKGNSRASPPKGNKNAVRTGQFETLLFGNLTLDEQDLFLDIEVDPVLQLTEDIKLLKVRQLRMMKRIAEAEKGLNQDEIDILYELRGRKKIVESTSKKKTQILVPELVETQKKKKTVRKINDILNIERALTDISNQLIRTIKQFEEIELTKARLAKLKAETIALGIDSPNEDAEQWKEKLISVYKNNKNAK